MPEFSKKSKERLATCDERLQRLFNEVIKEKDCSVLCGHRGEAEQNEAYLTGKSKVKWPLGNHNAIPSRAVDCMPYPIKWDDKVGQKEFADFVLAKAKELGINIRWGGTFKNFYDAPHYELVGE